jgi:glucosyl-3-phosphoglycerate synthase
MGTGRELVSVCLPARDEAATVGDIVEQVRASRLVDEVVVIDDGSVDGTAEVAARAGATVVAEAGILPEAGPGTGKGNVLWKALAACRGDIVCFVDADLRNFRTEYVDRLCEPLLLDPATMFVKAYYLRSFEGAPSGGGRVTELVARPLLSLLFPKLADVIQPLGGEYAARRRALEVLPFVEGWGVELGLLIDIVERFGRASVVQVDLGVREHRNRPVDELAPQALAVLATGLSRAGLVDLDGAFVELLRASADGNIAVEPVEIRERPPIITFESYRGRLRSRPPRSEARPVRTRRRS